MKRVIVADDDPGLQDVMELILQRAAMKQQFTVVRSQFLIMILMSRIFS